jgi:hypothetical protein
MGVELLEVRGCLAQHAPGRRHGVEPGRPRHRPRRCRRRAREAEFGTCPGLIGRCAGPVVHKVVAALKVYQRLWVCVSGPLTIVWLIIRFILAPIPVPALFIMFGAFSADLTACLWQSEETQRPSRARRSHVIARNAMVVGAAVGAYVGYSILWAPGGLLLLILVLASSPCAVSAYGRWLHSVPAPSSAQLDIMVRAFSYASPEYLTFQPSLGVAALTDEELCQSWQSSYTALQHQFTAAQMAKTVAERQA